jgi:RHS repeat-associated protein
VSLTRVAPLIGLLLLMLTSMAHGATASLAIGFDTDNNPATGCTLTVGGRSMQGVEVALHAVVTTNTNTGTVGELTRRTCTAGVFGAPALVSAGNWPVGMTNGLNGSDLVEASIAVADLAGAVNVKIGAITASESLMATRVLALTETPPAAIPTMSPTAYLVLSLLLASTGWLMRRHARLGGQVLLLCCVAGATLFSASALAVILYGSSIDWTGIAPLATDSAGNAPVGEDLVALYAVRDGARLALRVDMVLAHEAGNQPPVVNAGANQTITLPAAASLAGSATDDGLPNPPATLTYVWTKLSGPGTVTFGNPASAATSASFSASGAYVLSLRASDSALSGSANVTITVNPAAAGNQPPVVNAGSNQTITLPSAASLAGSATDDGLPNPPATLTYAWTKLSGPGTVTLGNAASAATSAGFSVAGTYVLRLSVSDSALSGSANVTIIVNPVALANQPPVVNAGANQSITLPAAASLAGSATDDGLPNPPATLSYAWTKLSGPGTVTFGNAASAATSAGFSVAGTYVLRLSVSDSALSGSANVTIIVNPVALANQPPVVTAGANQTITLPAAASLAGSATDDGLPNPPATLNYAWTKLSGPGTVTFGNPASLSTSATFASAGTYTLRLSASDGALSASSDTQISVSAAALQLLSVVDRTISLGTRYQQLLVASDVNVAETLTYALLTSPAGATLNPSPLIDWTPTAAQLGSNTFTARVTDSASHSATATFHVTVVHTNHAPQLAFQPNAIVPVGTVFSRTLQAADPDSGDTLAFSLISPPAGMTLTGAALNWPTSGRAPGDYAVTVKVTDAGALTDSKQFTVTLIPAAPAPVAKDDSYEVHLNQTLTVPAVGVPGVLGNDLSLSGSPLTAIKLTDPDKGTLNAFNADGGFNYSAPATLPPAPGLNPVVSWRWGIGYNGAFVLAADFDHNGVVDYVSNDFGNLRAWRGSDGLQLWQFDKSITTNANVSACQIGYYQEQYALGNVTGNGDIYLFDAAACEEGQWDRIFAVNASQIVGGKVAAQWKSERLSRPHPGAYATATSSAPADPPVTPFNAASATGSVPTLAKLTVGGATKLLTRFLATDVYGPYFYKPNSSDYARAACRTMTGLPADEGRPCKATFVIDATTGAIDQVLTAPNAANQANTYNPQGTPTKQNVPIVADLDGDGQVEIISGGDVWKLVGGVWTLAWQAQFDSVTPGVKIGFEPVSVAVADLDGDGKAEVIIHMMGYDNGPEKNAGGIHIFNHDGTLRRTIPKVFTWINGLLSVADVDGDGAPEILLAGDSFVYAYRQDGTLLWAKLPPDIISDVVPAIAPIGNSPPHTTDSPLYVYDLNLDGVPEVIIQGTRRLFILDGRTGAELWSIDTESSSYYQHGNPILVDADGDGHIDILVHVGDRWNCNYGPGTGPVDCKGNAMRISGADNNWAPGPKVQNQLNFRPTAINDAAQILYDSSVRRDFRQQIQLGTVIDPRIAQSTSFTYKANDGIADSAPATVRIDIKPPNRPPVITSTPPTALFEVSNGFMRIYTITAVDPDPGDTVHYEFVSSNYANTGYPNPTVDSVTGDVVLYSCVGCGAQRFVITVAAVDTQGARAEQSFIIDLTSIAVAVPNVIGQLLPAASAAIEVASLTPLVVAELFGPQPAGTVIGQDPLAGTASVGRSATVRLTVSKGPQPYTMPFVVGQQLAPTNALLTSVGLSVNVASVTSLTIPAGEIMSQAPAAGTVLQPASAPPVALTVSVGGPLPMPIASIVLEPGPGPFLRLAGDELQYKAIAILTDGTSADITLSAVWSSSLTGVATVNTVGIARAIANGTTTISATRDGKTGQGSLNVASRVLGDNTPPTAAITSPADGGAVTGPTPIVGTASDTNFLRYELAYAVAGDENYTLITEGTTAVTNGTLGTLDPTLLLNDLYTLRLTVFDRAENQSVATQTVQVRGNMKIGLFTLGFQDLNMALAGVPITVTRTYDSRDKAKGDFGLGWRLSFQTLRVRTNRVLGTGWLRTQSGASSSLAPTSEHKVSVTLPDGQVEEFDLQIAPMTGVGLLTSPHVTGYTARPGTQGKLEVLGNIGLWVVNGGSEDVLLDDNTFDPYDPKLFRYTTLDGTQLEIHRTEGVKKITDRNGNSVTIGPNGITHSSGKSVTFARDAQGRISQITDAMGSTQAYWYDSNGDLTGHTGATGAVSRYRYDRRHNLIDIQDALGNHGVRNEYDATGRLIATTDANGHQVTYSNNPGTQTEIITDRRGVVSQIQYDGTGNATSIQKGVTIEGTLVSATISMSYDTQGNVTSKTDPDGLHIGSTYSGSLPLTHAIDPTGLNLGRNFSYNAHNDVTQLTDPGGRVVAFTYDPSGNLTGFTSPLSGSGTSVANAQGLAISNTDALGNSTTMTRDASGNVTREDVIDASSTLLRRTDFTYDANGNKTSEVRYRTISGVLTPFARQFAYDPANRPISVTDPAGSITRTEYDANGQVSARIDPLGRRTSYQYDALGKLTQTTMPDGSVESSTYDVNGNRATSTDAAGRTTSFTYDEFNRQVRVMAPDGSFTQTIYSPGGRVAANIDARGNRTDFAYDTAGRRISTTLPAVANGVGGPLTHPSIANTINLLGAPVTTTDPNGRVTSFEYDGNGRLTRAIRPDGSTLQQTFDALGRRTSVTNEEGQTTTYGYDGLGRLVSVAGLAGNATYGYDEMGNLATQVDALGRTTSYRYDALNRLIRRQYPGGASEQFAYDAVGNTISRTDGLGRVTTFTYDAMNRLISKVLPGGVTITTTYHADGQRATVTDPRGVTSYVYDSLGQLASVTHPTGETVNTTRDVNSNLLTLASPAASTSYSYDALNRLVQVSAPEGASQTFYDLAGNRLRQTHANGIVTDMVFDNRNRPTVMTHKTGGGTLLQSYSSGYSPSGRRLHVTELDGSTETYGYDAKGRLASEVRSGTNPRNISHTYDAVGNRLQTINGGTPTTFAYDNDDRLLGDGTATYTWDANGNLVNKTEGAVLTQYGYDAENRLLSISGGSLANQYAYDADGNRVQSSTAAGTTRFLVDTMNNTGMSQVLEEKNAGGVLQARYSYGSELLAMARNGAPSFHVRDPFGSTRALSDTSAALTDQYQYDSYGNTVSSVGSTVNANRYRGQWQDVDSGLYQLRARYYNPGLGRFMTRDPLAGKPLVPTSLHRYAYANQDPVNSMDPSGRESILELTITQAIDMLVNAAGELPQAVASKCTASATAEQASAAALLLLVGVDVAMFVGTSGLVAAGMTAAEGGVHTAEFGYESPELPGSGKGLKKFSIKAKVSGGRGGLGVQFTAHDDVAVVGDATWTPFKASGVIDVIFEKTIAEFKPCYVSVGKLVAKADLAAGFAGTGAGAYSQAGVDVKMEASLFRGAMVVGMPIFGFQMEGIHGVISFFGHPWEQGKGPWEQGKGK